MLHDLRDAILLGFVFVNTDFSCLGFWGLCYPSSNLFKLFHVSALDLLKVVGLMVYHIVFFRGIYLMCLSFRLEMILYSTVILVLTPLIYILLFSRVF